jgi:hypothetical protein
MSLQIGSFVAAPPQASMEASFCCLCTSSVDDREATLIASKEIPKMSLNREDQSKNLRTHIIRTN